MCNTGGSTPHSLLPAAYVFIGLTLGFIFLGCKSGKSYFLRSSGIPVLLAKVSSNPRRHSTTTNPFSIRYYSKAKITLVWNEGSQIGIFGSFSALIDCFSCYWAKYYHCPLFFSASCLENWLNFTPFFRYSHDNLNQIQHVLFADDLYPTSIKCHILVNPNRKKPCNAKNTTQ